MKPEKAISIINDYDVYFEGHTAEEIVDAMELAIEALQKQIPKPVEETHVLCTETHAVRSDTISRQAVITLIENKPYSWDNLTEREGMIRALKNLPSEELRWIPVTERFPDAKYGEGDSVLCCTETGLMYILYWDGGNWCVPTGEPHQWVNHKTGWHDRVIAWMPLPEPYRGGE